MITFYFIKNQDIYLSIYLLSALLWEYTFYSWNKYINLCLSIKRLPRIWENAIK